jgi:hypothetical protein
VRLHFQVRTETHVMLSEVADLQDAEHARVEAAQRVGAFLLDHASRLWIDERWQMDVTDERGLVLFVIYVEASKAPATTPIPRA